MKLFFILLLTAAMGVGLYFYFESYDQVVEKLEHKCQEGDIESCKTYGEMRLKVRDYDDSIPALKKACEAEHVEACYILGMHFKKFRMKKEGRATLELPCQQKFKDACKHLKEIQ